MGIIISCDAMWFYIVLISGNVILPNTLFIRINTALNMYCPFISVALWILLFTA